MEPWQVLQCRARRHDLFGLRVLMLPTRVRFYEEMAGLASAVEAALKTHVEALVGMGGCSTRWVEVAYTAVH